MVENPALSPTESTDSALTSGEVLSFDFTDSTKRLPAGRLTLTAANAGGVEGSLAGTPNIAASGVITPFATVLVFKPAGAAPVVLKGTVNGIGALKGKDWAAQRVFSRSGLLAIVENTFSFANGNVSSIGALNATFFKCDALSATVFGTARFGLPFAKNVCTVLKDGAVLLDQNVSDSTPVNANYKEVLAGDAITFRKADGSTIGRAVIMPSPANPFLYSADTEAGAIPLFGNAGAFSSSSGFPGFERVSLQRANSQRVIRP